MRVKLAIAADDVKTGKGGKPDIEGVFTEVPPPALPAYLVDKHLVLFCEADATEFETTKHFEIYLLAADGERLVRWQDYCVVSKPKRPGNRAFFVLDFLLERIPFPEAGDYAFSIVVDGDHKASLPIYVQEPSEANKPEEGEIS